MRRLWVALLSTGLLVVTSCASDGAGAGSSTSDADTTESTAEAVEYTPVYATVPCDGELFEGRFPEDVALDGLECGTLTVPEDRTIEEGREVTMPVAILRSGAPDKQPDPYVYFSGGPGDAGIEAGGRLLAAGLTPTDRDFIWFDQRGTGRSEPSLSCPEVQEDTYDRYETTGTPSEEDEATMVAVRSCFEDLRSRADLDNYDTPTVAEDVADLREALGIEEWNIFGISYGTTVALEVLRSHPEGVRSAVIDSVYPPTVRNDMATYAQLGDDAFERLYEACADDEACNARYPTLEQDVADVAAALDATPYRLTFTDPSGTERVANITGLDVVDAAFFAMYDAELIPLIPLFVEQLKSGNYSPLDLVAEDLLGALSGIADGVWHSVECADRSETMEPVDIEELRDEYPLFGELLSAPVYPDFCEELDLEPVDDSFREVPPTEIPTLVLAGELDPVTPTEHAADTADRLGAAATYVEFPGIGHGASPSSECGVEVFRSFLADPGGDLDTACVDEMTGPAWVTE